MKTETSSISEHLLLEDDQYLVLETEPELLVYTSIKEPLRFKHLRMFKTSLNELSTIAQVPFDERSLAITQVSKKLFRFGFETDYNLPMNGWIVENENETFFVVIGTRDDPHKAFYTSHFSRFLQAA